LIPLSRLVNQLPNFASFFKKQRPGLPAEISILLFFINLIDLMAGNTNAETGKNWTLINIFMTDSADINPQEF